MTPRQARIGVDIFTALVVISIGIALAGLTWRLAGDPGQRFGAAPVAARPTRPVDVAPLIALAPFGTGVTAPTAAQATDGALVLRGILMAVPASASSALISLGGAAPQAFYVGQAVGPGTIESIAVDHVVIAGGGGGRQMLSFPDKSGGVGKPGATPAPVTSAPPPPTGPTMAAPPPIASPATLLASLGATIGGDGLHVSQPSDRTRAAGLQAGDVVQKINGVPVADLMQSPQALASVQAGGNVSMTVLRNGQPVTLSVPVK